MMNKTTLISKPGQTAIMRQTIFLKEGGGGEYIPKRKTLRYFLNFSDFPLIICLIR